jgi:hypothetical protein
VLNSDAQKLRRTVEGLVLETGLSAPAVLEILEAMAALLLDRARDGALTSRGTFTVSAENLHDDLRDMGLLPEAATLPSVARILESLLEMAR